MGNRLDINGDRLIESLFELGKTGIDENGERSRLEATDEEKEGRDLFVKWVQESGLDLKIDRIGNIFGVWETEKNKNEKPIMMGSHIDSVINAGIYDGCYGVLSGLEVIRTLKDNNYESNRPLVVGAFTNEEGVRYQPDMLGSLVYVGDLDTDEALETEGIDGSILGDELKRIGYYGDQEPGFIEPFAFIEAHVEQGPILDKENISVGAVENLQGISWTEVTILGEANHGGTTPMYMRKDAGLAAARVMTFIRELATEKDDNTVAMSGRVSFEPGLVNVIPSKVVFTIDLRNPNEETLKSHENRINEFLKKVEEEEGVKISTNKLARFEPVKFNQDIVELIERFANERSLSNRRMTSGAGHDAQMLSRICPTAMIFVPSINGISHNPEEDTNREDLINGTNVLLDVVLELDKQ